MGKELHAHDVLCGNLIVTRCLGITYKNKFSLFTKDSALNKIVETFIRLFINLAFWINFFFFKRERIWRYLHKELLVLSLYLVRDGPLEKWCGGGGGFLRGNIFFLYTYRRNFFFSLDGWKYIFFIKIYRPIFQGRIFFSCTMPGKIFFSKLEPKARVCISDTTRTRML
jgi:hypothetical protein